MLTRRQLLSSLAAAPLYAQRRSPNIILIVSDDHHWQCLGAAGNPHIQTPHLDKLASRGVLFRQAVISTSQCAPSRGILLSGLEGYQSGLDSNGHTAFGAFQGSTVIEQLQQSGYETHLVGKWHIDPLPKECGFTKAPVWLRGGGSKYINPNLRHGLEATTDTETQGHITDIFTKAAINVIQSAPKQQKPYLLWLTYNAPHTPWTASEPFQKLYAGRNADDIAPPNHPKPQQSSPSPKRKKKRGAGGFDWNTYYAVISEMDAAIGQLVDAVDKTNQWNNTLILFVGDNGYLCGSKGLNGKVHPWEESVRVPQIVAGGPVKRTGTPSDATVASIDLPATILDYAGVKPKHQLAGISIRPTLEGRPFPRDVAFSCWNDGRPEGLAIKVAVEPYRLVRTPTHKLIVWESKKEALFDLKADPFEENNLAASPAHQAVYKQLKDKLRARIQQTNDRAAAWL
jgi:N-acetylglucosamine-6-sulfatase